MAAHNDKMGISGRIAAFFLTAQITPLLALVAFLLGAFAVLVTPREEEPQINVTMANVLVPFPGASVQDVEQMVATPVEGLLAGMQGRPVLRSRMNPVFVGWPEPRPETKGLRRTAVNSQTMLPWSVAVLRISLWREWMVASISGWRLSRALILPPSVAMASCISLPLESS